MNLPAPGTILARARAQLGEITTQTFTLKVQVFSGSTDCSSGGGAETTLPGVNSTTGHSLLLGPGDSVLFTSSSVSDQSNELPPFPGPDLSGRFAGWQIPVGQPSDGITNLPDPEGRKICVAGFEGPGTREVMAGYAPTLQLYDSTCTNQRLGFNPVFNPGETMCIKVLGGLTDGPGFLRFFIAGGSVNECTWLPGPGQSINDFPITTDPQTFTFTLPSSNAEISPGCAAGNTTDIRGSYRTGLDDGSGLRAVKRFLVEDPVACALNCSPNISVTSDSNSCGANVNFPTPGGPGCGTVTCDYSSGSFFPVGTTKVTCTSSTGPSCSFDVTVTDGQNPSITAPPNIVVNANNSCVATGVALGTPATSDNCVVASVTNNAPASFPLGTTNVIWTVTDVNGRTNMATQTVTVVDAAGPVITGVSATPSSLWPPNHKMKDVVVSYSATDNCGTANCIISSVTSNEPVNGTGDGDTSPDWNIIDAHKVQLRAERAGGGSGRIYTIVITCTDAGGNSSSKSVTVTVPKSQGK